MALVMTLSPDLVEDPISLSERKGVAPLAQIHLLAKDTVNYGCGRAELDQQKHKILQV